MEFIETPIRKLLLACTVMLTASAVAAPHQLDLPAETAKLRTSTLPGYAIATQKCAICHSADYINYQPPGMTQTQWTSEMAKMQHAYGAPISDEEVKQIGAYLAVAYGSAKMTDAEIMAASGARNDKQLSVSVSSGTANVGVNIDVKALLNSNGCLGCHAIDKKVVGPAYHDVAMKYKGDGQAFTRLEASIHQGGAGKWGQVPMPPFSGLSEAQLHALAAFVLAQ